MAAASASAARSAAGATRTGFAAREIENPGAPTQGLLDEQGAAAGLLDVIAMRSDGKDVDAIEVLARAFVSEG